MVDRAGFLVLPTALVEPPVKNRRGQRSFRRRHTGLVEPKFVPQDNHTPIESSIPLPSPKQRDVAIPKAPRFDLADKCTQ